jgi:hypothetical protein
MVKWISDQRVQEWEVVDAQGEVVLIYPAYISAPENKQRNLIFEVCRRHRNSGALKKQNHTLVSIGLVYGNKAHE